MSALPAMTWRLVAMRPSGLTTNPVPSDCSVRTETTEGVERAAISAGVRSADRAASAPWGDSAGADVGWRAPQEAAPRRNKPTNVEVTNRTALGSLRHPRRAITRRQLHGAHRG